MFSYPYKSHFATFRLLLSRRWARWFSRSIFSDAATILAAVREHAPIVAQLSDTALPAPWYDSLMRWRERRYCFHYVRYLGQSGAYRMNLASSRCQASLKEPNFWYKYRCEAAAAHTVARCRLSIIISLRIVDRPRPAKRLNTLIRSYWGSRFRHTL